MSPRPQEQSKVSIKKIFINNFFDAKSMIMDNRGQNVVEYSLLIGIVIAVVIVLSPMVKQGSQAMVKIVADEIGNQVNSEQRGPVGLIKTDIQSSIDQERRRLEWRSGATHSVQAEYDESTATSTTSNSRLGVRED